MVTYESSITKHLHCTAVTTVDYASPKNKNNSSGDVLLQFRRHKITVQLILSTKRCVFRLRSSFWSKVRTCWRNVCPCWPNRWSKLCHGGPKLCRHSCWSVLCQGGSKRCRRPCWSKLCQGGSKLCLCWTKLCPCGPKLCQGGPKLVSRISDFCRLCQCPFC